jgi:hypothetical protein
MTTVDFGHDWLLPDGRRALLCWHRHDGQLVLHHPSGRSDLITVIRDEDEIRSRLDGWEHHAFTTTGLGWLADRLGGAR